MILAIIDKVSPSAMNPKKLLKNPVKFVLPPIKVKTFIVLSGSNNGEPFLLMVKLVPSELRVKVTTTPGDGDELVNVYLPEESE